MIPWDFNGIVHHTTLKKTIYRKRSASKNDDCYSLRGNKMINFLYISNILVHLPAVAASISFSSLLVRIKEDVWFSNFPNRKKMRINAKNKHTKCQQL